MRLVTWKIGHHLNGHDSPEGVIEASTALEPDMVMDRSARENRAYPTDVANLYLLAGDNERAMQWLERAYETRDPSTPYLRQPQYYPLRSDPRFQDLMRKMGLLGDERK